MNNKNNDIVNYIGGNVFIKTDLIYSFITIKGFGKYILSILTNDKILFILLINFCSRFQKLKLKTEYKNKIVDPNLLFANFFCSFCGYLCIYGSIFPFLVCCKKNNNKNEIEKINVDEDNKNEIEKINVDEDNKNQIEKINVDEDNKNMEKGVLYTIVIVFLAIFVESVFFF